MRYLIFIMMLINGISGFGQYPKVFVNQGSVTVNNRFKFPAGETFDIRPNLQISLNANSIITCKRGDKISAHSGVKIMTYEEVMSVLDQSKVITDSYFENMFSGNYKLNKEAYGSVGRDLGNERQANYYYPIDSMIVITDSVILEIGNSKTQLLGQFTFEMPNGDTFKIAPNKNSIKVAAVNPGEHHWGCDMILDGEEFEFDNIFFVPDLETKKRIRKEYQSFQSGLIGMDKIARQYLLKSWLNERSYYFLD